MKKALVASVSVGALLLPMSAAAQDDTVKFGILVVIGEPGVYIDEAQAMDHVAGFCVINDVSEREFQLERAGTWDKGKGCDTPPVSQADICRESAFACPNVRRLIRLFKRGEHHERDAEKRGYRSDPTDPAPSLPVS